jgi:hypothetical protein
MPSSLMVFGGAGVDESVALCGMAFLQGLLYRIRPLRSAYAVISALLVKFIFSNTRAR